MLLRKLLQEERKGKSQATIQAAFLFKLVETVGHTTNGNLPTLFPFIPIMLYIVPFM